MRRIGGVQFDVADSVPVSARRKEAAQVEPQDIEAEQALLGACLAMPAAIEAVLPIVQPGDGYFYRPSHNLIYAAIVDLHKRQDEVDVISLAGELGRRGLLEKVGGKALIFSLTALCPVASRAAHYAERVAEVAAERVALRAAEALVVAIESHDQAVIDKAYEDIGAARERARGRGYGARSFVVLHREDVTLSRPMPIIPGRMFRGSLAVIGGRQGDGKGKVKRDLWARATRGGPWPFGDNRKFAPLTVIDLDAEDDPGEVIFPEYDAAGADYERLHVVHCCKDGMFPKLSDAKQLEQLEALIGNLRADIISIDPVSHFFPGVKFNEAESVVAALSPLMRLAQRTRSLIVPFVHFAKGTTNDALAKFLGSGQWTAIARSALGVVEDPDNHDEDRERRQLWTVKCNIAPKRERKPWGFEITGDSEGHVRVAWDGGPATTSEADAFRLESRRKSSDSKESKARAWLMDFLSDGKMWRSAVLCEKAAGEGHPGWAISKALKNNAEFVQKPLGHGYKQGTTVEWGLASALQ